MGRGIEGTKIFRKDVDREDFLSRLAELCRKGYLLAYAWAFMDTHIHIFPRRARQVVMVQNNELRWLKGRQKLNLCQGHFSSLASSGHRANLRTSSKFLE
jgi:REP element-mobilizing transposase RayT